MTTEHYIFKDSILRNGMNIKKLSPLSILFIFLLLFQPLSAQKYYWMTAGSLHNWFSEMGCEREVGRSSSANQQDGMQWPAILPYQDSQAMKGLWIGAKNFTDERGDNYPYKVITVGPRSTGYGEFFPTEFKMVSRFDSPIVMVDGLTTYDVKYTEPDEIDWNMNADRMIVNTTNTLLGLTMTRKIMQFSIPGHDNYIVQDITFTNTGNIDDDPEIELTGAAHKTLQDVRFFYLYRLAPSQQTRFVIGNATGWAKNTMYDARGDGDENVSLYNDIPDERNYNGTAIRAQFAWHGFFPDKVVDYDNIGGPIWDIPSAAKPFIAPEDTVGRLGSTQFVGVLTLHADKSDTDSEDDPTQPSTTAYYLSDADEAAATSDPYDVPAMRSRYNWMELGHMSPRHARSVQPDGQFYNQTAATYTDNGGFSMGNGYGPYQIAPNETVRIVMVEAVNGLSTENALKYGIAYKNGEITPTEKNIMVMTGKDSLFKTFRNAIDNYLSDYSADRPPKPPKSFTVNSGGDRISLEWDVFDEEDLAGFKIFRSKGSYNNPLEQPELIYTADKSERAYDDLTPIRNVGYYYYIVAVGDNGLESSRYYTQTYDPAYLKRAQGNKLNQIRVVPNPYIISADSKRLLFDNEPNKIAFFNIPGQCKIRIFTETGELVRTLHHTDGSGDHSWDLKTSSNQIVVSGVYIAHVEVSQDVFDNNSGAKLFSKGESKIVKFVIVR